MYDTCTIACSPKLSHSCHSLCFATELCQPPKKTKKTERSWLNLGVKLSLKGGRRDRSRQPPTARARCAALSLVVPPWSKRLSQGCLEDGGCVLVMRNAMFGGVFNMIMIIRIPTISSICHVPWDLSLLVAMCDGAGWLLRYLEFRNRSLSKCIL